MSGWRECFCGGAAASTCCRRRRRRRLVEWCLALLTDRVHRFRARRRRQEEGQGSLESTTAAAVPPLPRPCLAAGSGGKLDIVENGNAVAAVVKQSNSWYIAGAGDSRRHTAFLSLSLCLRSCQLLRRPAPWPFMRLCARRRRRRRRRRRQPTPQRSRRSPAPRRARPGTPAGPGPVPCCGAHSARVDDRPRHAP